MFNEKALAMVVRARRLQLNYTQEYVAFKLNLSQNAYSKLELGNTTISVSRLFELCEALEIDALELLRPFSPPRVAAIAV
ncbi:hypothetical protein A0256_22605 [Mucilaginibacter sp. PAMC 26640]|nr:hypothetical protein A0256_22605 [Mucilaginibacter sp. PAMC 26640]